MLESGTSQLQPLHSCISAMSNVVEYALASLSTSDHARTPKCILMMSYIISQTNTQSSAGL
jgi:hypothetical protein